MVSLKYSKLELYEQVSAIARASEEIFILGITGSPGAGKTRLAKSLQKLFQIRKSHWFCTYVPMDGFHLPNNILKERNLLDKKGAPETFDSVGYAELLKSIKSRTNGDVLYAPDFNRGLEESIAGSIIIPPECRIVITEGIHLGRGEPSWVSAREQLSQLWYLDSETEIVKERLLNRRLAKGENSVQAEWWYKNVDKQNADKIEEFIPLCDRVVELR